MKMYKVFLAMVLVTVTTVSLAFAAGQSEEGAVADDDVMTITWMSKDPDAWAFEAYEEKFGVNIESNGIFVNDSEKVNVMLAAGEFPDVGPLWDPPLRLWEDGVTRTIPFDAIRDNAPKYSSLLDRYPLGWLANRHPDEDEEFLALSGITAHTGVNIFWPSMRIDWIREVGYDLPNYDSDKMALDRFGRLYFLDTEITLDWLEDVFVAFGEGDPDGNGRVDTIPVGAYTSIHFAWGPFLGAYGIIPGSNRMVDGELYDWRIDPGMKEFLIRMADWYEMGLIDREFANLDAQKAWEKAGAGQIGYMSANIAYAGQPYAMNRVPNNFVPDDELGTGAEVVLLPPPRGPEGEAGGFAYNYRTVGGYRWYVNAEVDDTKLAKILEIFDYFSADDEGWVYRLYGKPDVHFDWQAEPWESFPIRRDPEDVPDDYPEVGPISVYPPVTTPERMVYQFPLELANFYEDYLFTAGAQYAKLPARDDFFSDAGTTDIQRNYGDTMETLFQEFFYRAITGAIDIDSEWDTYVDQFTANGWGQMKEALMQSPVVPELVDGKVIR